MKPILPLLFSSLLLSCDSDPETKAAPESPEQKKTSAPTAPPGTPDPNPASAPTTSKQPEAPSKTEGTEIPRPTPQPRVPTTPPEEPTPPEYKVAKRVPGRPGFVYNPWTNEEVDVRGVPGGILVRDPKDSNSDHKFRTPK